MRFIHLLTPLLFAAAALHAQTAGQSTIVKKNVGTGSTYEHVLISPNQILGRNNAGVLSGITLGSGLSLTGTTLSASASGSYQPLSATLSTLAVLSPEAYGMSLLEAIDADAVLASLDLAPGSGRTLHVSSIEATSAINAQLFSGLLRTTEAIEFEHTDETLSLNHSKILAPVAETPAVTLTLPLTSGRLIADTSAISGSQLTASSVPNQKLANSTITINGTPVALGGSTTVSPPAPSSGAVIQMRTARESAQLSGTTLLSVYSASSAPAMSGGNQVLTLTITPTSAANRIRISTTVHVGTLNASHMGLIIGRSGDTLSRAAAQVGGNNLRTDYVTTATLDLDEVAGTTSPITYIVKIGGNVASTYYLNRSGVGVWSTGTPSTIEAVEYIP